MEVTDIGCIGNTYGGLKVLKHEGKFYWIIENYDTNFEDISEWEQIREDLYHNLIIHNHKASLFMESIVITKSDKK